MKHNHRLQTKIVIALEINSTRSTHVVYDARTLCQLVFTCIDTILTKWTKKLTYIRMFPFLRECYVKHVISARIC